MGRRIEFQNARAVPPCIHFKIRLPGKRPADAAIDHATEAVAIQIDGIACDIEYELRCSHEFRIAGNTAMLVEIAGKRLSDDNQLAATAEQTTVFGVDTPLDRKFRTRLEIYYLRRSVGNGNFGDKVAMEVDTRFWEERERNTDAFAEEMKKRISNLRRGDLVFFGFPATEGKPQRITHVGIYIGENHIIHASHLVRINSLLPTDPDYYENSHRLLAARRL